MMKTTHCFHKLYCCTHHCVNHFADDIRGKLSCAADFYNDKGQQPLQRLDQSQILHFGTAGMKETANRPLVRLQRAFSIKNTLFQRVNT